MFIIIRRTSRNELRALPILLRRSPGAILPNSSYVLRPEAVEALRKAGMRFTELSRGISGFA
jgi:hypothetical protein